MSAPLVNGVKVLTVMDRVEVGDVLVFRTGVFRPEWAIADALEGQGVTLDGLLVRWRETGVETRLTLREARGLDHVRRPSR